MLTLIKETQRFPDSQLGPLGPKQEKWIKDWVGSHHFRDKEKGPLIKLGEKKNEN